MPDGSRVSVSGNLASWDLVVKSVDEERRIIRGMATTPNPDRTGDIVEPLGAKFAPSIPLFLYHDARKQVGEAVLGTPTKKGIPFEAHLPIVKETGTLKDMVDEAWQRVKYGLIKFVSIGFRPINDAVEALKNGGLHFLQTEILELSLVPIPMQPEAAINYIKSIDLRAAPGPSPRPGASGKQPRSQTMSGIAERRSEVETKVAEVKGKMTELSQKCDGDVTKLSADELHEFDTLNAELDPLERDLARYRGMEKAASESKAIPSSAGTDPDRAFRVRNGDFNMKSNLPKGTAYARATIARARAMKAGASISDAAEFARKQWPDTPEVSIYLKANPGTGLSGNWAEPLNVINTVEGDFIEMLRPATVIGRLNLRRAPFNVKMIRQTSGSTVNWVGRAAAKPVGEQAYDTVTVPQSKIAGIVVLTDDQIMSSHIDSVEATRRDMIAQVAQFADEQFLDPTVAAVADVNPASVTYGVNDVASNGALAADVRADIYALLNRFGAANIGLGGVALVMSSFTASGIAMMTNALGQAEFPTMNVDGGTLRGLRVIVSDNIPGSSTSSIIVAIKEDSVLLAQDGGIKVDMSRDATIDMGGGDSPTYSLFQKNSVALRTEWWVSWVKARDAAVQYVSGVAYAPQPA